MRPLGWGFAGLVLGLACASYDPGADYRSRLEPLADAPAVRPLGARDFAVPPPLAEASGMRCRALGPGELRSLVAGGGDPVLSAGASWNGQPVEPGYVHYLSKNLYRWSVPGSDGRRIVLAPAGRPVFEPPWGFTVQASGVREFLAPP